MYHSSRAKSNCGHSRDKGGTSRNEQPLHRREICIAVRVTTISCERNDSAMDGDRSWPYIECIGKEDWWRGGDSLRDDWQYTNWCQLPLCIQSLWCCGINWWKCFPFEDHYCNTTMSRGQNHDCMDITEACEQCQIVYVAGNLNTN